MEIRFAHWKDKDSINPGIELLFQLQRELIDLITVQVTKKDTLLNSVQPRPKTALCRLRSLLVVGNVVDYPGEHTVEFSGVRGRRSVVRWDGFRIGLEVEDFEVDFRLGVESFEKAAGQSLAFVGNGVANFQIASAVAVPAIEVIIQILQQQRASFFIQSKAIVFLVEEFRIDFSSGEKVDTNTFRVDSEQFHQIKDQ